MQMYNIVGCTNQKFARLDCCQSLENLHLVDEINLEAFWKVEFGYKLSTSKNFNFFLCGPSGMKVGMCIVWSLLMRRVFQIFYTLICCCVNDVQGCPINFVTENEK